MRRWILLLLVPIAGLAGCATEEFKYVPAERQDLSSHHRDEALYNVPAEAPIGSIRILSQGIEDVKPISGGNSVPALHINVAISDKSATENWVFDPAVQAISFPNQAQVHPILAVTQPPGNPAIEVRPQELRTVDLYFPLPQGVNSTQQLPKFDYHWQVQAGSSLVRNTTMFDRVRKPETYYAYGYPYDPFYWGGPVPGMYGGFWYP
jgi:hypothetical protein